MTASKDPFDQLLKEALALEELEVKEKGVSLEEPPAVKPKPLAPEVPSRQSVHIEIKTFQTDTSRKKVSGSRIWGWIFWVAFLFLTTYLTLAYLEQDSLIRQSEVFLQTRQRQVEILRESLRERKREARNILHRLKAGENEKELLEKNLQFLNEGFEAGTKKGLLLMELVRRVPRGVWLWGLTLKKDEVRIQGFTTNQWLIRRFLRSLGRSPHFQDPRLVSLEVHDFSRGIVSFEIQC